MKALQSIVWSVFLLLGNYTLGQSADEVRKELRFETEAAKKVMMATSKSVVENLDKAKGFVVLTRVRKDPSNPDAIMGHGMVYQGNQPVASVQLGDGVPRDDEAKLGTNQLIIFYDALQLKQFLMGKYKFHEELRPVRVTADQEEKPEVIEGVVVYVTNDEMDFELQEQEYSVRKY
jgi:hypothetical protein